MYYHLYKTPQLGLRTDESQFCSHSIATLLLSHAAHEKEGVHKLITVPAQNTGGFDVVACHAFFKKFGNAAYVFLPETEHIYQFCEAVVPIRDPTRRFLKAGLKGLVFGAEEQGFVEKVYSIGYDEKDEIGEELLRLLLFQPRDSNYYHFTGTAELILEELRKKVTPITSR
ncbi:MAG TPA: hypothetical protein VJB13_00080 [Candidatus Nanoarchaeia archaeon]|nr:hypothetical protein [Candidatus Nanoarchaeia archaeon]